MITILEMTLVNYLRLKLQNIKYFSIKVTEIYQLIIGTNGSGKSSIMSELSAMPAYHKEYGKGGSKTIFILKGDHVYKLVSDFSHGNDHYFNIAKYEHDDYHNLEYKNLNEGRTYTVQKKLVEEHFGINQEINDLMTGITKFTDMSMSKRREWILKLSGNDLDYAIGVYNKLRKKLNASVAVKNHLNKRLNDEYEKKISDQEFETLKTRCATYSERINTLLMAKYPNRDPNELTAFRDRIMKMLNELEANLKPAISSKVVAPSWYISKPGHAMKDLDDDIYGLNVSIANRIVQRDELYEESNQVTQLVNLLASSNVTGTDDLVIRNDHLFATIEQLKKTIVVHLYDQNVKQVCGSGKSLFRNLVELFSQFTDNTEMLYTRDTINSATNKIEQLKLEIRSGMSELDRMNHQLEHMTNAKQEQCPACNHRWFPGIERGSKEQLQGAIYAKGDHLRELQKQVDEREDFLSRAMVYVADVRRFNSYVSTHPEHSELWNYLGANNVLTISPFMTMNLLQQWDNDLDTSLTIHDLETEIGTNLDAIAIAKKLNDGEMNHNQSRIGQINQKLESCISDIQDMQSKLDDLREFRTMIQNNLMQTYDWATGVANRLSKEIEVFTETAVNATLDKEISGIHIDLATSNNALSAAKSLSAIIESLDASLVEAKQEVDVYQTLTQELSPTDGLIADYIRGFIEDLVAQINEVIGQIWTYDMKVLPCAMDNDGNASDLDYKFPLSINGGDYVTHDVFKSSSAQRDIVNFGFLLAAYVYLGLDGYPLYLDELAPTMDEVHRVQITHYLKALVDAKSNSQVFMISHYISGHGVFTNAEICILSESNLIHKPREFNQHVVIK